MCTDTEKKKMTLSPRDDTLATEDEGGGLADLPYEKTRDDDNAEETEDEEVKVNCIGGVQDSDLSSDDDNDDKNDEEDHEEDAAHADGKPGLLHFVSSQQPHGINIQRPLAVLGLPTAQNQALQDVQERDDDEDDSSMDESSEDE